MYILSAFEAMPLLCITLLIKVFIMNLKGYIIPGKFLYFEEITRLNQEGGLLYRIPYLMHVLTIVELIVILNLNAFYGRICYYSTIRENHKTNHSFNNSLILKR